MKTSPLLAKMLAAVGLGSNEVLHEEPVEAVVQEAVEQAPDLAAQVETLTADLSEARAALETARASLEEQVRTVGAIADEAVASLTAQNESLASQVSALEASATAAAEATKTAMLASRKEKLVAVMGTEAAEGMFAAAEAMTDVHFASLLTSVASARKVESKTSLFTEQGVSAERDASAPTESAEMRELRAKYPKN